MKRLAIINPCSGNGRTGKLQNAILDKIKDIVSDHVTTKYQGHCREVAQMAGEYDGLVAVGGDGTVCEIINGMDLERQTLAVIPTGTGNSLARHFMIRTLDAAVDAARKAVPSRIDLVKFIFDKADGVRGEWYCASTASLGYAARVTETGNKRFKNLGVFCYPVSSLVCASQPKHINVRVSCDNGPEIRKNVTGIMVQNARYAGNFELFPDAKIVDGFFDVMELDAGFIRQMFHNISMLSRLHFYQPKNTRRSQAMHIISDYPQNIMIDGEIIEGVSRIGITIAPAKLKCFF
jgi:diacylglycerol kinase family enzyme